MHKNSTENIVKICLDEIERCRRTTPRPNFIMLLGDRYGWRPPPAEVLADEVEEILGRLPTDEIEHQHRRALLDQWYRRDDNANPPVYCLQTREGEVIDYEKWEPIEQKLHSILLESAGKMQLKADRCLKYVASATEQEIARGALCVPDAQKHVFGFFRNITNLEELVRDLPLNPKAKGYIDLDDCGNPDREARIRLKVLKRRKLRPLLRDNLYEYGAKWTGKGVTTDHIPQLCREVFDCLSRTIKEEIEGIEKVDSLDREIANHATFGQGRARSFVGRAALLQAIGDYVKGADRHPLAISGESGAGKTALLAHAAEKARQDHPNAETILRFIGATPDSSDGRALLRSLCLQISRRYGADEATIPVGYKELVEEFPRRLALATEEKPLIAFLDALDQLSDVEHARHLLWLPADLPEHVRLIVSTLPGECQEALERKLPPTNLRELKPMPSVNQIVNHPNP